MLTAKEILRQIELGRIVIDPFEPKRLNPNSYDLTLGNEVVFLGKNGTKAETVNLTADGVVCWVQPGDCVLATTRERTYTPFHIPQIAGKSSLARQFCQVHMTAGFGDIGFDGQWTLEIVSHLPFLLTPGMKIAQIYFTEPTGEIDLTYNGRYQNQCGPTPARPEKVS